MRPDNVEPPSLRQIAPVWRAGPVHVAADVNSQVLHSVVLRRLWLDAWDRFEGTDRYGVAAFELEGDCVRIEFAVLSWYASRLGRCVWRIDAVRWGIGQMIHGR